MRVVEFVAVRGRAVYQCGNGRIGRPVGAEHRARARAGETTRPARDLGRPRPCRAPQRDDEVVEKKPAQCFSIGIGRASIRDRRDMRGDGRRDVRRCRGRLAGAVGDCMLSPVVTRPGRRALRHRACGRDTRARGAHIVTMRGQRCTGQFAPGVLPYFEMPVAAMRAPDRRADGSGAARTVGAKARYPATYAERDSIDVTSTPS